MSKSLKAILAVICCAIILIVGILIGMNVGGGSSQLSADEPRTNGATESATAVSAPYVGSARDADVLICMPDLRQYSTYTCGATCVQMVLNWALPQEGDINLADLEAELGTSDEGGTTPDSILGFLNANGVSATMRQGMAAEDLAAAIDQGHPVIIAQQAWSTAEDGSYNTTDPSDPETYLIEGHYVVCVGYRQAGEGYDFYFNDPANVGLCTMTWDELDARWIDMDANGNVYEHTGIVVDANTNYNPEGVYHLD